MENNKKFVKRPISYFLKQIKKIEEITDEEERRIEHSKLIRELVRDMVRNLDKKILMRMIQPPAMAVEFPFFKVKKKVKNELH